MIDKGALRRELRGRLRALSPAARARGSADAARQLAWLANPPAPVMLYAPLPLEVDVWPLVVARVNAGRKVGLPRIEADGLSVRLLTPGQLTKGQLGIQEPDADAPTVDVDVVVVPGLGFDGAGARLGRGKGYYDRLLAKLVGVRTVGVGFDVQRLPEVPMAPHDVRLHATVFGDTTEAG